MVNIIGLILGFIISLIWLCFMENPLTLAENYGTIGAVLTCVMYVVLAALLSIILRVCVELLWFIDFS